MTSLRICAAAVCVAICASPGVRAAGPQQAPPAGAPQTARVNAPAATLPPGFVIGPADVLSILFWGNKDMSAEMVTVRPDGKVSLPLLNDIQAAGLTPEELRANLGAAGSRFIKEIQDSDVTVFVREVHSRNVFIQGNVGKSASYPLATGMDVLQLIATAGGLLEYADSEHIVIIRTEGGRPTYLKFNWKDVIKQKRPEQNIQLKPGDSVIVP